MLTPTENSPTCRGYADPKLTQVLYWLCPFCGQEGKAAKAFVPLAFDLGEAFQFDWSDEGMVVGGIPRRGIYDFVPGNKIAVLWRRPLCGGPSGNARRYWRRV